MPPVVTTLTDVSRDLWLEAFAIGAGDLAIGDPNARPDLFEWSPCHGHFHLRGAANYELLSAAGDVVLRARHR